MANESKRWTAEAKQKQRDGVKRWKPWESPSVGRPGLRNFDHAALAAALMGMKSPREA